MCKKLIVLALSLCLISSAGAETVKWDFENGNDHGFYLQSTYYALTGPDDPNTAGDEAITGVGGMSGLPEFGVAWSVGRPDQYDGQKPAVDEGDKVKADGTMEYNQPGKNHPFTFPVNSRGQESYLNTYNLSQWGDNLHIAANDQIATSRQVLLGEEAKLTVWSLGGGSGTHAPEYDADPVLWYTDGSSGIAVISAEGDDQYAILATLHLNGKGTLTEDTLDLSAFAGRKVFIDVVDAFEGGWGWLAVDEIQITEKYGQAAMIVSDPNLPNGLDQAQKDRLESLGYEVTLVTGSDVADGVFTAADAETFNVLVVSESIDSSQANNLIGANVPMMHQESFGWSSHFFTQGLGKTWLNDPAGEVNIVNDAHPIAMIAGLAAGQVAFFTDPNISWTTDTVESLVAGAENLAQIANSDGVAYTIIFTIEAGTELADPNMVAANRIVGFSLPGQDLLAADVMTYDAWALFDAAINWLDPRLPEMVAHWPMDEGAGTVAADVVGGNDGTLVGGVTWCADGALGGAVSFDDIDGSRIEVPHSDAIDFGDESFSVSLWIRYPEGVDLEGNIDRWIIKGTHAAPRSGKRYELFHKSDVEYSQRIRFVIDDGIVKSRLEVDPWPFITGDWVNVVAVRDTINRQLLLYANGVKSDVVEGGDTGVDSAGDISSGEPLWIGESTDETATAMLGDIDDLRIFDGALTEDEIPMIYSLGQ